MWPHGDYPLIEVGKLTLDRNLTDYHTEMEQAAFEPNNLVPGITLSPDKMLLARGFSYADAHRARLGVNYKQIPVNSPKVPVHSYSKDGAMRVVNVSRPGVRAELQGRPAGRQRALPAGRLVRRRRHGAFAPTSLHAEDDDWGQAGTMVREVLDDAARERLVSNIVGHLLDGVTEPVLAARLRVLAQRGQEPRRQDRGRRPRQAGLAGPNPGPGRRTPPCRQDRAPCVIASRCSIVVVNRGGSGGQV